MNVMFLQKSISFAKEKLDQAFTQAFASQQDLDNCRQQSSDLEDEAMMEAAHAVGVARAGVQDKKAILDDLIQVSQVGKSNNSRTSPSS